ncbi:MAG: protoporphyrinogen oxidase [Flammeovirgaceae bacterium]|jgi:protoporphyrinogen oxidase
MKKKIIIVGGGITGLATAYIASKSPDNEVTVLEGSPNLGGLLNTFPIGGTYLEHYYHHFFTHDAEINWLIQDLGIADKLIFRKTSMGVFRNGKIFDFNSPLDLVKFSPINLFGKAKFGLSSLFLGKVADWKKYESVSALEWFYKYAGKNVTDSLWKPLLNIKFGPYADRIPLAWMIGRLRQRMNSRKNGEEQLGYVEGSLRTLLLALIEKLKENGVRVHTNAKVEELILEDGKAIGAKTENEIFLADQTVLTIPSNIIEKLVEPHNKKLATDIGKVKYFGAVCTILELDRKLSDIYWLNIADGGYPFGGVIEHTNFIPKENYEGKHLVYLSRYFALEEDIAKMSSEEIKKVMIPPLKKIYPDFDEKWILDTHIFKTNTAATICDLGFSERIVNAKLPINQLYLANMMHIYPDERSVNNSIRLGAETCRIMGIDSDFVPKGNSMSAQIGFND